jgi:hypothetical protein
LTELNWIGGHQACELLTGGVDHEQIAVRTVVPAEADVGTRSLGVRRVGLETVDRARKRENAEFA